MFLSASQAVIALTTCVSVSKSRTSSTRASASFLLIRDINFLIFSTVVADIENSSSPIPTNIGASNASPAISPQIAVHLPSLCDASIVCLIILSRPGLNGW